MNSTINVKTRPLKIGWCIKKDDFEALLLASQLSNTFWGGYWHVMIPIDNENLAKKTNQRI